MAEERCQWRRGDFAKGSISQRCVLTAGHAGDHEWGEEVTD